MIGFIPDLFLSTNINNNQNQGFNNFITQRKIMNDYLFIYALGVFSTLFFQRFIKSKFGGESSGSQISIGGSAMELTSKKGHVKIKGILKSLTVNGKKVKNYE